MALDHPSIPDEVGPELQARALNDAQNGIVIVDAVAEDQPIIWANRGFLDLTGYCVDEIVGRNCRFLQGAASDKEAVARIRTALDRREFAQETLLNYRKDGSEFWNELSISPVKVDSERVTHFIGVQNDVTERERARRRFEDERRIAEMLQTSLLLTPPLAPELAVEISHYYQAHEAGQDQIGGDFFDYFPTSERELALVIGDVEGKGLEAAAQIAQVKYSLRALLRETPRPSRGLYRMNDILNEVGFYGVPKQGRLVSVAIVILDTGSGKGVVSAAGIEPPLLLRRGGGVELLEVGGSPLGSFKDVDYDVQEFQLAPGDQILMVTDGVTEVRRDREFLYMSGLADSLRALNCRDAAPDRIVEQTREIARTYGGGFKDDVCILACRRK